ncbi:hypothetical protein Tco_0549511 [Tanacetum coccineum]
MSKLDRFLVSESVISGSPNIKAVTLERFLSDHRPILLKENGYDYGPTPFRFFHHWLEMMVLTPPICGEHLEKQSICPGAYDLVSCIRLIHGANGKIDEIYPEEENLGRQISELYSGYDVCVMGASLRNSIPIENALENSKQITSPDSMVMGNIEQFLVKPWLPSRNMIDSAIHFRKVIYQDWWRVRYVPTKWNTLLGSNVHTH